MEENDVRFQFDVSYNNEIAIKAQRKKNLFYAIVLFLGAAFFVMLTILMLTTSNEPSIIALVIFLALVALAVGWGIYFLLNPRYSEKNNKVKKIFIFTDFSLLVEKIHEHKPKADRTLENCLLRRERGKQYVSRVFEYQDIFEFKIFTGTFNLVPQYNLEILPKDCIAAEEYNDFVDFLKETFEQDYKIK